ncbi:MAG: hypothetical protein ACRD4R_01065 [Candidatus Acidiferrales bacterium]
MKMAAGATPSNHWFTSRLACICCLILFAAIPAFGFCFEPHATVACDFLNSDAVFTGKVLSVKAIDGGDAWQYRVSVIRLFRGPHNKIIDIYTGNDSGGYTLDANGEYLIFAYTDRDQLWITNCDDTTPLSRAGQLIGEIESIAIPRDGIIEGRVILSYVPSNKGLPGVNVFIHGERKTYRLITDHRGWFRLDVPPGVYSIEPMSTTAHPIVAYDLNYGGNSKKFVVKRGRCAGFEFIANSIYKY